MTLIKYKETLIGSMEEEGSSMEERGEGDYYTIYTLTKNSGVQPGSRMWKAARFRVGKKYIETTYHYYTTSPREAAIEHYRYFFSSGEQGPKEIYVELGAGALPRSKGGIFTREELEADVRSYMDLKHQEKIALIDLYFQARQEESERDEQE